MIKHWLKAFRLRTLPLAFSSVITGTAVAIDAGFFDWLTFSLALITTLFLQILSNLANDYGDSEKGIDNENRIGPKRSIQSGYISKIQMKKAIIIFVFLCLLSGSSLVFYATRTFSFWYPLTFILVGVMSIVAAIKYTLGKDAYGYKGLGDLFVFMFFGLVGVAGTSVLYVHDFYFNMLFPSVSIGCLSTSVLNLNNMRDFKNDKNCGKNTLVVKIGIERAKKYHVIILIMAVICSLFYTFLNSENVFDFIFLIAFTPLFPHIKKVTKIEQANLLIVDAELKKVAISTFLFSILFWISIII